MITYHDAFAKANHYLDDADLPVVITLHGRFSQGWYFCFEAREFLETGDEAARLAGNAPFIIDKDSTKKQIVCNRIVGLRDTWAKLQKIMGKGNG